jgi:hypothetical protein
MTMIQAMTSRNSLGTHTYIDVLSMNTYPFTEKNSRKSTRQNADRVRIPPVLWQPNHIQKRERPTAW